ncbi:uncharacterized protein LOC131543961 isoform X2 [Onychostoma macrolepis]|uniref:uncharacterized protein LOC131543961 isoform X2 n=1 Tax=Onychostoma macrolepis TaxID=369639 RepID=UPI00272B993A|nr:uncharacterized protein LOC131543961 isoform X2 [Onychostoma macrolepis]
MHVSVTMEDKNNYSDPDISDTSTEIHFYDPYMDGTHHSSSSYIRLCIFLITSVCVGLPALVWASRLLYLHMKIREQISSFIVLLLLSDLIQLLLTPLMILLMILNWTPGLFQFWPGLYWCGFHLHQLVALEGVLTLKYPLFSARIFSCPCYTIIFIFVFAFSVQSALFFFMEPFVNTIILLFNIGSSLVSLSLLAVSFTITGKASSTPVSENTRLVFTVAVFTFVWLYSPFMLFICVNLIMDGVHTSWFVMCLCLMSLRVISDPILCVLVCRGNLRDVQIPQTHIEHNADQMSVSSATRGVF